MSQLQDIGSLSKRELETGIEGMQNWRGTEIWHGSKKLKKRAKDLYKLWNGELTGGNEKGPARRVEWLGGAKNNVQRQVSQADTPRETANRPCPNQSRRVRKDFYPCEARDQTCAY